MRQEAAWLTGVLEKLGFTILQPVTFYLPPPIDDRYGQRVGWDVYLDIWGDAFRVGGAIYVPRRYPLCLSDTERVRLRKMVVHRVLDMADRPLVI